MGKSLTKDVAAETQKVMLGLLEMGVPFRSVGGRSPPRRVGGAAASEEETACGTKVGDKVRLQSGGPVMTVSIVHKNGTVTLLWFGLGDADVRRGVFPKKALRLLSTEALAL